MDRETELAFEAARDTSKQIITLTTAIILVPVAFSKDFIEVVESIVKWLVLGSGVLFILSIASGVWTLMALTGKFDLPGTKKTTPPSIWDKDVIWPAYLQIMSFGLGLSLVVIAMVFSVF